MNIADYIDVIKCFITIIFVLLTIDAVLKQLSNNTTLVESLIRSGVSVLIAFGGYAIVMGAF